MCPKKGNKDDLRAGPLHLVQSGEDKVVSNLILWELSLPMAGDIQGSFQPKLFYESMIT